MQNRPFRIVFAGLHVGRGDFPAHHHEVWELVYVRDGAVVTVQDGLPLHLAPGMILVNPPYVSHRDVYVRPYHLIYLFVEGSALEGCERIVYDDPDQSVGRVFEAALAEWNAPLPDRDGMLRALAAQLEVSLHRRTHGRPTDRQDHCVIEAKRLLRDSVGSPRTLDEVAAQVGVSRSWLHQEFSRTYGRTPHEYVAQLRLEKTLALLRHSSHKVAFIAAECGYASGSHLTHHLRKITGLSPTEIRAASRKSLPILDLQDRGSRESPPPASELLIG